MPTPTVIKQPDGSFIVREEEIGLVSALSASNQDLISRLRAHEMRLRDMKSTRVKPMSSAAKEKSCSWQLDLHDFIVDRGIK